MADAYPPMRLLAVVASGEERYVRILEGQAKVSTPSFGVLSAIKTPQPVPKGYAGLSFNAVVLLTGPSTPSDPVFESAVQAAVKRRVSAYCLYAIRRGPGVYQPIPRTFCGLDTRRWTSAEVQRIAREILALCQRGAVT